MFCGSSKFIGMEGKEFECIQLKDNSWFLNWFQSCIKVALDFVTLENVQECVRLTEEYRLLPKGHRAKEDKLEVFFSLSLSL